MKPAFALILASLALGACTTFSPRPWDKDLMARHEMQVDPNPVQTAADNHVYFSKEASSGGQGFAGGGCGCN